MPFFSTNRDAKTGTLFQSWLGRKEVIRVDQSLIAKSMKNSGRILFFAGVTAVAAA